MEVEQTLAVLACGNHGLGNLAGRVNKQITDEARNQASPRCRMIESLTVDTARPDPGVVVAIDANTQDGRNL
jgi:hypothetical protein